VSEAPAVFRRSPGAFATLFLACALAFSPGHARAATAGKGPRVLATPSFTEAMTDFGGEFANAKHGSPEFTFAAIEGIRKLIEKGGGDVVATSDTAEINALWRAGLVEQPRPFAQNVVAIVAAAGDSQMITYASLTRPGAKVAVAVTSLPLGRYTEYTFLRMSGLMRMGFRVVRGIRENIVVHATGEREVLARVMSGEADAGFVYATDIEAGGIKVKSVTLPDVFSPRIPCSVAVVTKSARHDEARAFVDMLTGDVGKTIMRRHGFLP
jgi:molybdate transport system substrate-binding protein